jgi:hypothetical protein
MKEFFFSLSRLNKQREREREQEKKTIGHGFSLRTCVQEIDV